MVQEGTVQVSVAGGISTVSFFHPQSNSLPGALLRKLAAAIEAAGRDAASRVIVLRSEGERTFCAGASFDELASIRTLEEGQVFFSGFAAVINAMRKAPKFVIARVQGKAVGGGIGLASAADYCLAHRSAAIKLSELAVGIGPFVVGPAVERKMGKAAFMTLAVNAAEWHSPEWAQRHGLYAGISETVVELDAAVDALAGRLAASNPEAMKLLKQVFWEGADHWDDLLSRRAEMSGHLVLSDFAKNAIARFKAGAR
jgi:methylglutaconyl-CoA hydratase